jgi:hypothetical protein
MKLRDLLQKLNSEERPYSGGDEFFQEVLDGYGWVDLSEHGFTYRPITEWNCTDTWVGDSAIYLNGELVCITSQSSRKDSVDIEWISKEVFEKVSTFVRSLVEPEEDYKKYIDFDSEVDPYYELEFTGQLTQHHTNAMYQGKCMSIDRELTSKEERNDYLCRSVWIFDDNNPPNKVDIRDLRFPVILKKKV